jgi:hypothetical protein
MDELFKRKLEELLKEAEYDDSKMTTLSHVINKWGRTVSYYTRDGVQSGPILFTDMAIANEYYDFIVKNLEYVLDDEDYDTFREKSGIPGDIVDIESFGKYKNDLDVMESFYIELENNDYLYEGAAIDIS